MAVEIADGFDTYASAQITRYYSSATANNFTMVTGCGGVGQAIQIGGVGAIPIPLAARAEYIFSFDFYATLANAVFFVVKNSNGDAVLTLSNNDSSATALGINGTVYSGVLAKAWQNITVRVVISVTVGEIIVRVDGVVIYAGTGLNTGTLSIVSASLQSAPWSGVYTCYFDNFVALNALGTHSNSLPTGRLNVRAYYPNADGSYTGFTPNSGSTHYTQVNEAQADDDASYVSSTASAEDSYDIQSLPGSGIDQVHAVQVRAVYRKTDLNPKVLHVTARSSSALAETADISVPMSYASSTLVLPDDPNTSDQWVVANVNALQIGVKEIS